MKRRAIAILGLTLLARTPVAAQTAPVIDGQNGTVTISAQTLAWFRQRLAEEEEHLRQLQITVQQIARALPNATGTAPSLSAVPTPPAAGDAPSLLAPTPATARPATGGVVAPAVPSPALAAPVTTAPGAAATPKPGAQTVKPGPRIAVPMWTPGAPSIPPTAAPPAGPDVSGSPVPILPGSDDAAPLGEIEIPPAPDGAQAHVTTEPAVVPLAASLRPGLSLEEVRRIKGTPALISRNEQASVETWSYPDGSMTFQGGRLTTWKLRSAPPAPEPVARRAPRVTPVEERMGAPRIAWSGATDTDTAPETAAPPPPPAGKIAPEKPSVELRPAGGREAIAKVAPSRTTTGTSVKRVRRTHWRSRRWASHHQRNHRWVRAHHRHRRYVWNHRHHHRWAKGTARTVGRQASVSNHCRICQMARAHLRSGHRGVVMTEVAGWRQPARGAAAARVPPPQRASTLHRR